MATRIEHRATFSHRAADVFAAQTDPEALRARLAEIGGKNATLADHEATTDGVRYTLLQGLGGEQLPGIVRTIHQGDLTVERRHTWSRAGDDRYTGTISVHVSGVPGRIEARTEITPQGDGSIQVTRGEVTVHIPLVGGKLESFVSEQVTGLLEHEAGFTASWLAGHR